MFNVVSPASVEKYLRENPIAPDGMDQKVWEDPDCGPMLKVFLGLSNGDLGSELSELDLFYNRYSSHCQFLKAYTEKFGFDVGIEQQNGQLLEHLPEDVDWDVLQKISES